MISRARFVKLNYAAALALVGWYLMIPTPYDENSMRYEPGLPLSKWTAINSFDSAEDCANVHAAMLKLMKKDIPKGSNATKEINEAPVASRLAFLYTQGQCISTDDPRLKENWR
jgi:hypothetical protein